MPGFKSFIGGGVTLCTVFWGDYGDSCLRTLTRPDRLRTQTMYMIPIICQVLCINGTHIYLLVVEIGRLFMLVYFYQFF